MKIAIDIREAITPNRTGKGWYAFQMITHLLEASKNEPDISFIFYTDRPNADLSQINFNAYKNVRQKYIEASSLWWHIKVIRDLKKEKPDIYFAPTSFIVPAFAPKSIKMLITVHDLVAWLFPGQHNKKATLIERLTLPRALGRGAFVTTVSENTKKDLMRMFDVPSKRVTVIPCAASQSFHPLPAEEVEKFRKEKALPQKFILAVGTLEPRKNLTTLIKSMTQIPDEVYLLIIGGKGWRYEEIFDQVKISSLHNRVKFLGYVDEKELPLYYNAALCLAFPSQYEGFGMPPLEAMQSGCPVICANTSSLPEVVGDGALLVDGTSLEDLPKAINQLLFSPKLASNLREKGLIQAKKFSWERSAESLMRLLLQ